MSQENVEIVRRANEALQGVDVAPSIRAALAGNRDAVPPEVAAAFLAWMNLFDPDVEIDTSRVDMPGFGVFRGFDGLVELFGRWIEEWEHYSWIHQQPERCRGARHPRRGNPCDRREQRSRGRLESQPDVYVSRGQGDPLVRFH